MVSIGIACRFVWKRDGLEHLRENRSRPRSGRDTSGPLFSPLRNRRDVKLRDGSETRGILFAYSSWAGNFRGRCTPANVVRNEPLVFSSSYASSSVLRHRLTCADERIRGSTLRGK